ncbi:MAG TPA: SMC-Scp complex subunit ScpB [Bacteroidota bacterium]|nr:SMC-Scp complex subunit ScpB [Bacteroidota bacterium]
MPETTTLVSQRQSLSLPAGVKELIEALIFAAEEPLTLEQIKAILRESSEEGDPRSLQENEIETIISILNDEYQQSHRPYRIIRIAGGYQFATTVDYAAWIGKLHKEQGRRKLSQSSLETLAIIAYRQPITRPDIEAIRGVDCDYVLGTLLEKKLITIVGRAPTPGRPLLYGTTQQFLKHFGLSDISDLPRPREIEELLADARYETERRMLEAQEQAEKAKKEEEDFKSRLPHIPKKKPDLDDSATIVPKRPGRSLTVKKAEETQEVVPQSELDHVVPELPKVEATEIRDEITPPSAAPSIAVESAEQEETTSAPEDIQPALDVPVHYLPQLPSEVVPTDEESSGPEAQESLESTTVEDASSTVIDEPVQAEETVLPVDDEVVSVELKMIEQPSNESTPTVVDELPAANIAAEEAGSQQITNSAETQETGLGMIQTESGEVEMTSPAPEVEPHQQDGEQTLHQEEVAFELKTEFEIDTEQTSPPIDATFAVDDVAPPALAPIVDEVREPAQPKSRWTRFKEKIQGFIKKVFG